MAEQQTTPAPPVKCPECPPGLPGWMATFSDLVTLLLTFFVLLLSFAKTETAKYEAALGSIRNAFGGNVLRQGDTIQRGKSPEDAPTMLESKYDVKPFPIEFLTADGMLDKHEVNRFSAEDLDNMRDDLEKFGLTDNVNIYEMPEGIRVEVKDKVFFANSSTTPNRMAVDVYDKLAKMLTQTSWLVYVMGHSAKGEIGSGSKDAFDLSALRAQSVARSLIRKGVSPKKIVTSFYGDNAPANKRDQSRNRRVEFMVRKVDITKGGNKVRSR